jgi:hypothetical protein
MAKSPSISQLRCYDNPDKRKSYVYALSKSTGNRSVLVAFLIPSIHQSIGLSYFKNVILVSSSQDNYIPYHSARIEIIPQAATDPVDGTTIHTLFFSQLIVLKGNIYIEMVSNLREQLMYSNVVRLDVNFGEVPKTSMADWAGRYDSLTPTKTFSYTHSPTISL